MSKHMTTDTPSTESHKPRSLFRPQRIWINTNEVAPFRNDLVIAIKERSIISTGRSRHPMDDDWSHSEISEIPDTDWYQDHIDWQGATLSGGPYLLWYEVAVPRAQFEALFGPSIIPAPTNPGGRTPQRYWDAFWREACEYVRDYGIPRPGDTKEFVDHLENWLASNFRDYKGDRRTIEKKIAPLAEKANR
jgi:hypothetical protein